MFVFGSNIFCSWSVASQFHSTLYNSKLLSAFGLPFYQSLSSQENTQIIEERRESGWYGNIGAKGIKPIELYVLAVGEDAIETKKVGISVSRTGKTRQLTERGQQYQTNLLSRKRSKIVARLHWKARTIDDLLYSSSNHVAVREELQQLLSAHNEECCDLLGLEDQWNEVAWFDNLDQGVFNFKHKTHSWLRDSPDKSSSKASSKGNRRTSHMRVSSSAVAPSHSCSQNWGCWRKKQKLLN